MEKLSSSRARPLIFRPLCSVTVVSTLVGEAGGLTMAVRISSAESGAPVRLEPRKPPLPWTIWHREHSAFPKNIALPAAVSPVAAVCPPRCSPRR